MRPYHGTNTTDYNLALQAKVYGVGYRISVRVITKTIYRYVTSRAVYHSVSR
jgi:hypothetical protein